MTETALLKRAGTKSSGKIDGCFEMHTARNLFTKQSKSIKTSITEK